MASICTRSRVRRRASRLRAVATDGHRLAQAEIPRARGAAEHAGRHRPAQDRARTAQADRGRRGDGRDRACPTPRSASRFDAMTVTSKLIDGTFPDYERVIPPAQRQGAGRRYQRLFAEAVDRVSTISSEKGRAVKLNIDQRQADALGQQSRNRAPPRRRSAPTTQADPLDIGFNSRYLLDIAGQFKGERRSSSSPMPARRPSISDARGRGRPLCAHADAGLTAGSVQRCCGMQSRRPTNAICLPDSGLRAISRV